MKIKLGAEVLVPQVPNFLRLEGGGVLPIAQASDEDLEALGKLWTAALRNLARERRNRPAATISMRSCPAYGVPQGFVGTVNFPNGQGAPFLVNGEPCIECGLAFKVGTIVYAAASPRSGMVCSTCVGENPARAQQ